MEKTFLNNTIWYAFYAKVATFIDFEEIQFFSQKTQIAYAFEKSYYFKLFYGKFFTI